MPWTQFDARNQLYNENTSVSQLEPWKETGQPPSFVIDAIDNIESKVALLAYCHANALPVISSMGAGCKSDPTRVFIGDISASTDDPLSRSTRRRLRLKSRANSTAVIAASATTPPAETPGTLARVVQHMASSATLLFWNWGICRGGRNAFQKLCTCLPHLRLVRRWLLQRCRCRRHLCCCYWLMLRSAAQALPSAQPPPRSPWT